jgi:hypothetical protein
MLAPVSVKGTEAERPRTASFEHHLSAGYHPSAKEHFPLEVDPGGLRLRNQTATYVEKPPTDNAIRRDLYVHASHYSGVNLYN